MARIHVRVTNGIVTLAGYVERGDQRVATVQDAAQIEGVRVVVDNLRVIAPRPQSLVAAVQEPHASVARTARRSKAPSLSRGKAFHAALPADGLPRPVPAETIGASVLRSTMASSTGVVPAASVSSDTRSADLKLPGVSAGTSPAPPRSVGATPRAPEQVTVPYGTTLAVRLTESLNSGLNQQGDIFLASLASPVTIGDRVVIPAEAAIQGRVVDVRNAGRFSGRSALVIEVTRLAYNGKNYELRSSQYSKLGRSRDTQEAAAIASGAGVGAVIGAILGGGKGAAIGAVIGAGVGTGVQAATKTAEVQLPAAILSFRLETPLTVIPSSALQEAKNAGPRIPRTIPSHQMFGPS
jgi:BON domain-containing protein